MISKYYALMIVQQMILFLFYMNIQLLMSALEL